MCETIRKTAAILDDDKVFGKLLKEKVQALSKAYQLEFDIDVYTDPKDLDRNIKKYQLIFMDIALPGADGVTVVQEWMKSRKMCDVIYVSAYDDRMIGTFGTNPAGFVRKTHLDEDLGNALVFYKERLKKLSVRIPEGQKIHFVIPDDIIYLSSNNHYINFHMWSGKELMIRGKMDDVEQILAPYGFIRIHVSYLVNLKAVRSINKRQVCLMNNETYRISSKYYKHVYEELELQLTGSSKP